MIESEVKPTLSYEAVAQRKLRTSPPTQVMFAVRALYGLSPASIRMPLSESESIESGQICVTIDPDADPSHNAGLIDYERQHVTVRYGAQLVFPGLFELVTSEGYDRSLLNPVRAFATDECEVLPDLSGWHALGTMEFLPGSLWSGAEGG